MHGGARKPVRTKVDAEIQDRNQLKHIDNREVSAGAQ